jgi:hypothetical protein
MGKAMAIRGTFQVNDLRTLNAEINEILKEDIAEIDKRYEREIILPTGTVDQEFDFTVGMTSAKTLYIKADQMITVKIDDSTNTGFATTFMIHKGEIHKIYLSTSVSAKVKIIALDSPA